MDRKAWLEQQVEDLELSDLFTELSEEEKILLKDCKAELGVIYEKSTNKEETL